MAFSHAFLFSNTLQVASKLFDAGSHPARIMMLSQIISSSAWIARTSIVQDIPLSSVSCSQHLRKLTDLGIVESRNVGTSTEYRVRPSVQPMAQVLGQMLKVITDNHDTLRQEDLCSAIGITKDLTAQAEELS